MYFDKTIELGEYYIDKASEFTVIVLAKSKCLTLTRLSLEAKHGDVNAVYDEYGYYSSWSPIDRFDFLAPCNDNFSKVALGSTVFSKAEPGSVNDRVTFRLKIFHVCNSKSCSGKRVECFELGDIVIDQKPAEDK